MNRLSDTPPAHGKEFVILMAAMMSMVAISIDAMLPALTVIGEHLNAVNSNQPQLIISALFAGMGMSQLVSGPLSDALGRKRLLLGSLVLYLLGTALCLNASTLPMLILGRFIQGLGVAGPYVSTISIVRDRYSGSAMAQVMSLIMTIFIMVPAVAPTIGQGILAFAPWQGIFVFLFCYALVIMLWTSLRLEETLPREKRIPFKLSNILSGAKTVLSHRATVSYMLCAGCIFGCLIGYLNSCLQIFRGLFHTGDAFALYFGALALTLGFASLVNSKLVHRFGMRQISILALSTIAGASALYLLLQYWIAPTLWMFLIFAGVVFFQFGLVFGNMNALAMEPMGHIAGTAAAIIGFSSSMISMGAGTLIGQLYNQTLVPMLSGFLILTSTALLLMAIAETKPVKQSL